MSFFLAEGLHKRFGDHVVLEEVSLSFEKGRLSGIMGPNGAGKSTCFNVMTGYHKPTRGRIVFNGEDITGLPPHAVLRKGVARSFQIMSLFDELTVLENILVALPAVRRSLGRIGWDLRGDGETTDRAAALLADVGLGGQEFTTAAMLPYGQRRALEIALALASDPKIVFLDEPTQGLGAEGRAHLAALLHRLKRRYTIVMIEHDMAFLFGLAEQISVIHWGQVIAEGTPQSLRENSWVRRSGIGEQACA
ncbi:MAG TPA: ABC transporter ATP-binding protein [Kiloniellaceae bacterium]|nr:ABC transporter ATP-binding protein [Kiloniellaceae bacterium]